jgi:hypothetical protein
LLPSGWIVGKPEIGRLSRDCGRETGVSGNWATAVIFNRQFPETPFHAPNAGFNRSGHVATLAALFRSLYRLKYRCEFSPARTVTWLAWSSRRSAMVFNGSGPMPPNAST